MLEFDSGAGSSAGVALPDFKTFTKIPRLARDMVVTEKIDGTNGVVYVSETGLVIPGSRSRWLNRSLGIDNFGFAAWVETHADELRQLGPGYHYGEWWGVGIQRGYGLDHRRFSLFNVHRWADPATRPKCCDVVPMLYTGEFSILTINAVLSEIRSFGSVAAPGYDTPEGVVVYHVAGGYLFKRTIEGDDAPKGQAAA